MATMMARIHLDRSSTVPIGEQLRRGLERSIVSGSLTPGERIPTVRATARSLDVAPGTVAKAYRRLEAAGLLVGRGRAGTFVAEQLPERPSAADELLDRAARAYARRARQLGFGPSQALRRVRRAIGEEGNPAIG